MPAVDDEFPVTGNHIYLNHAAVAPWPRRTAEAVAAFAAENLEHGAARYPKWLETEHGLRRLGAWLIGAPGTDDIALIKNTSEGLSMVAHGLPWRAGDSVVGIRQEFPSNRVVWESLEEYGVEFRALDLASTDDPEEDLMAACDSSTRLLAVSSVQFADGFRLDVNRLGEFCRRNDIIFCVDAIQHLGALPFDALACHADYVIADGHKWMLGPEGLGFFYSHPDARERLRLRQFGWHMRRHPGDYEPGTNWEVSPTATRFECGSPNMLGVHALTASLSLLRDIGMDRVESALKERIDLLTELTLKNPAIELLSPVAPERRAGIVTLRHAEVPSEVLHRNLTEAGVICAVRGGGVRLSPHFYTPLDQIERTWQLLEIAAATS